jgi:hypothetical protein
VFQFPSITPDLEDAPRLTQVSFKSGDQTQAGQSKHEVEISMLKGKELFETKHTLALNQQLVKPIFFLPFAAWKPER